MFKKRPSTASTTTSTRRPGQALKALEGETARAPRSAGGEDDATQLSDASHDSDGDSSPSPSPSSSVVRPAKRLRRTVDEGGPLASSSSAPPSSSASLDPTLVTVPSSRSALPDVSSHSHRFAHFAPKVEPSAPSPSPSPLPSSSASSAASVSRFGPQKASGYARAISRMDYQPDVCKDWMECGSCGYGDSCKFLHDRLEYKQSWQLDKEWEDKRKKEEEKKREDRERRERGETVVEGGQGVGGPAKVQLPFACFLCRQPFTAPVVTACGHYFDEKCALSRFAKSSRCAICGKETQGSFTTAQELLSAAQRTKGEGQRQLGQRRTDKDEDEESDSDSVR